MTEQPGAVMQAFVVYRVHTGEIEHVHIEATLEGEPRRLEARELIETYVLPRSEAEIDPGDLDVLEVPYEKLQLGRSGDIELCVDTDRRVLGERKPGGST